MTTITKLAIYTAFFASGLTAVANTAAAKILWNTVGAGCIPTGQTSQNNLHFNSAGKTKFQVGRTGEIILTCPITLNAFVSGHKIFLSYKDPDGTGDGSRVVATLRKVDRGQRNGYDCLRSSISRMHLSRFEYKPGDGIYTNRVRFKRSRTFYDRLPLRPN